MIDARMSRLFLVSAALLLEISLPIGIRAQESATAQPEETQSEEEKLLRATAFRYFSADEDYRRGNLIVRSQVDELQAYLRRTRGPIKAANPIFLKRVLQDNSLLGRYFYRQGGAEVLRLTAEQLGGYGKLEALSATREGKLAIQSAIETASPQELIELAQSAEKPSAAGDTESGDSKKTIPTFLDLRIYTLEEYFEAVFEAEKRLQTPTKEASSPSS